MDAQIPLTNGFLDSFVYAALNFKAPKLWSVVAKL